MMKTHAELYPGTDPNCPAILASIEPGVQPLCDALNGLPDTYTLWSCEGHPERAFEPYVTFIAPQEIAFKLSKVIECSLFLKFNWELSAGFREDGSLQYTVSPNDRRLIRKGVVGWWPRKQWSHAEMCVELLNFAQLVSRLLGAQSDQKDMNSQILEKKMEKPIFSNAEPMRKKEAENLMMKVIIFSFSYGMLRVNNIRISRHLFFLGCEVAFLASLITAQELSSLSMWPTAIWMLYTLSGLFLVFRLKNSKDPEAAMQGQISSLIFKIST